MKSIKDNKPKVRTKTQRFIQGYFIPENPSKYKGLVSNIIYRSKWELKFMRYCDKTENIIEWISEPISIPYINPIDGKKHDYYVDFYVKVKDSKENIKEYLVEIKPKKQIIPKKNNSSKQSKDFNNLNFMANVNAAKFMAGKQFAELNNMEFIVVTEDFLFK